MLKRSNFAPISRKIELILRYNFAIMGVKFDNNNFKFLLVVGLERFVIANGLIDPALSFSRSRYIPITSI